MSATGTALAPIDQVAQGQLDLAPAPGTLEALTRSEIDTQISTAKRFPRSVARFRQSALGMATLDRDTAASCNYALQRKDKDGKKKVIEGPSVRLSEIVAVSWTNLRSGGRIIGEEQGFIIAQGMAHDLESNVAATVEVRRRITTRDGHRYGDDMLATTAMAAIAIAQRNALFKVIPRVFVDLIAREAKKVASCVGDNKALAQRRQEAVDYFVVKHKVPKDKVFEYISSETKAISGIDDIGVTELELLTGLWTALKEGEETLESAFGLSEGKAAAASPLAGASAPPPATAAAAATAAAQPESAAAPVVDVAHEPAEPTVLDGAADMLADDIRATPNSAALKKMAPMIDAQPPGIKAKVQPVYDQTMAEHKAREAASRAKGGQP